MDKLVLKFIHKDPSLRIAKNILKSESLYPILRLTM